MLIRVIHGRLCAGWHANSSSVGIEVIWYSEWPYILLASS